MLDMQYIFRNALQLLDMQSIFRDVLKYMKEFLKETKIGAILLIINYKMQFT